MRGGTDDVADPLSQSTAFSLIPRTNSVADFSSVEIQSTNQTFSHLVSVKAKESQLEVSMKEGLNAIPVEVSDSYAMEKERNQNDRNNIVEHRPAYVHKRGRFTLPPKPKPELPTVDYTILDHIKDPYEFFNTYELLDNAVEELKRMNCEFSIKENPRFSRAAREAREAARRDRPPELKRKPTPFTLPDELVQHYAASSESRNASLLNDSNTMEEGLNAIHMEVSSVVQDTAPKEYASEAVEKVKKLLEAFKHCSKDEEEGLIWESLNLKPTDISQIYVHPKFRKGNPISVSKGCLTSEPSEVTSRNENRTISDLQRRILERNPLLNSPIIVPASDDDIDVVMGDPFPSTSRVTASVSPKDIFKSTDSSKCLQKKVTNPKDIFESTDSSKCLQEKVTNGSASGGEVASVVHECSFQDEENVMPSFVCDAANNAVEELAPQNQENVMPLFACDAANNAIEELAPQNQENVMPSFACVANNAVEELAPQNQENVMPSFACDAANNAVEELASQNQVEASHIESPRGGKKQKEDRKKRKRREANQRKSLADGGLVWQAGTRRSTRVKSRPLKHWLGERLIYGRIHDSLATVVGVKVYSPTSKGPVMKVKSYVSDELSGLVEQLGKY